MYVRTYVRTYACMHACMHVSPLILSSPSPLSQSRLISSQDDSENHAREEEHNLARFFGASLPGVAALVSERWSWHHSAEGRLRAGRSLEGGDSGGEGAQRNFSDGGVAEFSAAVEMECDDEERQREREWGRGEDEVVVIAGVGDGLGQV